MLWPLDLSRSSQKTTFQQEHNIQFGTQLCDSLRQCEPNFSSSNFLYISSAFAIAELLTLESQTIRSSFRPTQIIQETFKTVHAWLSHTSDQHQYNSQRVLYIINPKNMYTILLLSVCRPNICSHAPNRNVYAYLGSVHKRRAVWNRWRHGRLIGS